MPETSEIPQCFYIYIVVSMIVILSLAYLLNEKNKDCSSSTENFCNCTGLQSRDYCSDPQELKRLYAEGVLTETTFPQKAEPSSKSIAPYDLFVADPNNYNAMYAKKYETL